MQCISKCPCGCCWCSLHGSFTLPCANTTVQIPLFSMVQRYKKYLIYTNILPKKCKIFLLFLQFLHILQRIHGAGVLPTGAPGCSLGTSTPPRPPPPGVFRQTAVCNPPETWGGGFICHIRGCCCVFVAPLRVRVYMCAR